MHPGDGNLSPSPHRNEWQSSSEMLGLVSSVYFTIIRDDDLLAASDLFANNPWAEK